jgi:hypothetical protein
LWKNCAKFLSFLYRVSRLVLFKPNRLLWEFVDANLDVLIDQNDAMKTVTKTVVAVESTKITVLVLYFITQVVEQLSKEVFV